MTIAVPRSSARRNASSGTGALLDSTTSAAPSSITRVSASGRLPTTTTSPFAMPLSDAGSIAYTHTRPDSWRSSPVTSSPSSTDTTALTNVGASSRVEVRSESRM